MRPRCVISFSSTQQPRGRLTGVSCRIRYMRMSFSRSDEGVDVGFSWEEEEPTLGDE